LVLSGLLQSQKLDAIVLTTLVNVRYYSGFTGSNGWLVADASGLTLLTDPRYAIQANQEAQCRAKAVRGPLLGALGKQKWRRIGVEAKRISHALYEQFSKLGKLVDISDAVEAPRYVKTAEEIERIRASVELNSQALERSLKKFRVGMRERDLAAEIEYQMRKLGASGPAFDTIVASGPHSALPHAQPRGERIEAGGYLLIDMGACLNGYMSDMTRTYGVGDMPPRAREIYEAVLESQLAGLDAVRPGKRAGAVHAAVVKVLSRHGLSKQFVHSTGHGLGLEIHEAPRLGKACAAKLEAGMVVTIEPGVYLEGYGGVRIEDTVLVTERGAERLTQTSKAWTILG
jgi:Xaa-Pro aminopeptidase